MYPLFPGGPPDKARAKHDMNEGCKLLSSGEFERGWRLYQERHGVHIPSGIFAAPHWRGEDLEGRHIFVWREQGVGDEIWFASCLPDLVELGAHVTVSCDYRLASLYRRSFPRFEVLPEPSRRWNVKGWRSVAADFHSSLGDLGVHLRASRDAFPDRAGFLTPDPERTAHWRGVLDRLGNGIKVGISWQGGPALDRLRHCPWDTWGELLGASGATFVNLQYGDTAPALRAFRDAWGVDVYQPDGLTLDKDIDGLAALAHELDLVVSIPNTTVHVAGAVGTPCLLLYDAAWSCFWVTQGVEVPWYTSVLVRKRQPRESWIDFGARLRREIEDRSDRLVNAPRSPAAS
ncbi:MAG: hypothetical protein AAFU73_19725 [Planctomycetota bacterium]